MPPDFCAGGSGGCRDTVAMPDISSWFYDGWPSLVRVPAVGVCAYVGLVLLLRISGKRTLSKMNAFDLVVTVALGSTLATTMLGNDIALVEGLTAFAMLIFVQWIVAWTCARSRAVSSIVKSVPTIILWKGELYEDVIRRERLTREEVLSAIRSAGYGGYGDVKAVVLETTGDLSVISELADQPSFSSLENVTHRSGDR